MRVLNVRNVNDALLAGINLLKETGYERGSRNEATLGRVVLSPVPVATVYERPWERVLMEPRRDANPFFHLYEGLWMLAGRNDVAPLVRYARQMADFSDDGVLQHGAYGHRWRRAFSKDQLDVVVDRLKRNHDDRRCVLQMWDTDLDLDHGGKDVPCNLTVTLQIDHLDRLQMVVFNRSNDIVWGAYGANAVHMSMLQEYLSRRIGVLMGTYTQVSVNFHAYSKTVASVWGLSQVIRDPYALDPLLRNPLSLPDLTPTPIPGDDVLVDALLTAADLGYALREESGVPASTRIISAVLHAHHLYSTLEGHDRYTTPINLLRPFYPFDWAVAGVEWLQRRHQKFLKKVG